MSKFGKDMNLLRFFMVLGLSIAALPVQAAESAWFKRCEEKNCEIVQRLMDQNSEARLLEMAIGFPADGHGNNSNARGVIVLPLGIDMLQPLTLQIDENEPVAFKVRYCLGDGCYAFLSLPADILNAMKKGQMGALSFTTYDGQPARLPLALDGFTKALKSIQ